MLQQTRVEAVKGYYNRFLQELPTVADLAAAEDDRLHKLWEGLGYYRRVSNLKKAAQVVMEQHGGCFPESYEEILALPGIGPYTAGAIASIAFQQPTPAVDGNVLRVVARLLDDAEPVDTPAFQRRVQKVLRQIYPPFAGNFTQALMELGATVCGPNKKPECTICPCREFCQGYLHQTAERLPRKLPKRSKREEKMTVLILRCNGCYALEKRPSSGLLASLWQFPNIPGKYALPVLVEEVEKIGIKPKEILMQVEREHIFTHIKWDMRGVYMEVKEQTDTFSWFTAEQIRTRIALPTAFRQFCQEIDESGN